MRRRDKGAALAGLIVLAAVTVAAILAPMLSPADPLKNDLLERLTPPMWNAGGSAAHPLGTDTLGRDVLSRLLYGARLSLVVGFVTVIISGAAGVALGVIGPFPWRAPSSPRPPCPFWAWVSPRRRRAGGPCSTKAATTSPPGGGWPSFRVRPFSSWSSSSTLSEIGCGMRSIRESSAAFEHGPKDTTMAEPHIVIVGGGFGGLAAARALAKAPVQVTLLDRHNHHLFQPLLYQVATAGLSPAEIASPIRRILSAQGNVTVLLAEATAVEPEAKRLRLADGVFSYDQLILATGATHSYFGRDDWAIHAPGLKTLDDALEIRRRVLFAFEKAEREVDAERRRQWLTLCPGTSGTSTRSRRAWCSWRRDRACSPPIRPTSRRARDASSKRWASTSGREPRSPAWTPRACRWEPTGWPPAPSCGRREWRPPRSPARSASSSTRPDVCGWSLI